MRSSWSTRLVSVFMAVASAFVVTGEAAGLHRCPVHDAPLAASGGTHTASHDDHASPASAAVSSDASADASHHQGESQHSCHCLGPCSAGVSTALPVAVANHSDRIITTDDAQLPAAISHEPAQRPHFLPFSIGPPAAV